MKPFDKRYDLNNIEQVNHLCMVTGQAHEALQQVEAGVDAPECSKASATFMFLALIGYYPEYVSQNGVNIPVTGVRYIVNDAQDRFAMSLSLEGDKHTKPVSIFGPAMGDDFERVTMPPYLVRLLAQQAFPKLVINESTTLASDLSKIYHVSVRPAFMQPKDYEGFPMESGSASCSTESVALMQAVVRMIAAHLTVYQMANLFVEKKDNRQKEKVLRHATEYGINRYGARSWRPRSLEDILRDFKPVRVEGIAGMSIADIEKRLANLKFDVPPRFGETRLPEDFVFGGKKINFGETKPIMDDFLRHERDDKIKLFNQAVEEAKKEYFAAAGDSPESRLAWDIVLSETSKKFMEAI